MDSVIHLSNNWAQKYKRVRANLMLGVTLQCTNTPYGFYGFCYRHEEIWKCATGFFPKVLCARPFSRCKHFFSRIGSTNPGADKKRTRCISIITWWWLFLPSLCLFVYLFFVLNRQLCYMFQCLHNQHALHRSVLNCDNEMCALKTILSKSERITLQSLWVRLEVTIIHKPRIQNRILPPDLLSVKRSPPSTNLPLKKNLEKSQFHKWN